MPRIELAWSCCYYAFKMSRLDSTRSIEGRMPSSLEMASDSSSRDMAFSRSPGSFRWSTLSAQISHAVKIRLEYFGGLLTPRDDTLDTLSRLRACGYKIDLVRDCVIEDSIFWPSTPMAHY